MAPKKPSTKKSNVVKTREKGVRKMQSENAARTRSSKAVKGNKERKSGGSYFDDRA